MGNVNELAESSVAGSAIDPWALTPPKFRVDQPVGFLGGSGTVMACQYGRGSWIYAIAPLPLESAEGELSDPIDAAQPEAVLLLQEKDLWAMRDGVAAATVTRLETTLALDNEAAEPSLEAELAQHREPALESQGVG